MITYDIAKRKGLPKYEYLHHCIRNDIRTGQLSANAKLPSKREFSRHLGVSISTIGQAYDLLVSEGYIEARPGSGFYVCPNRDQGTYQSQSYLRERVDDALNMTENQSPQALFPAETWARLMRKTLSERDPELLETVPFSGLLALRLAIVSHLYEFKGICASPDQVVIGAGTEYLYGRLLQLFGSRCTIAIGDYGSKNLFNVTQPMGTRWDYFDVDKEGLCLGTLEESPADVVHVSPANHFPTGAVMSQQRRSQLIKWASHSPQRYIIEDDYDSELRFSGRALPSLFAQDDNGKVIYLNTFSKTLVPSIRISYMVLPLPLMELYRKQLSFYSCTVSSFEQYTLAQFISGGFFERHIMRLRRHYDRKRISLLAVLEESPLMSIANIQPSEVGTHLLMHVNTRLSDDQVKESARKAGMHLSMLSDYCVRPSIYNISCIVLNVASIPQSKIPDAVKVLELVFADDIARVLERRGS